MKFIHTADWHLGKLVQGIYMTEDQRYILEQFIDAIKVEKPDAVIIAGDLYDRAVPPTEAVHLLNEVLDTIVLDLSTPVLAIAGNHDSPSRVNFGSKIMERNGFHIVGELSKNPEPIILSDEHGEVHFYLIPYCDPSIVRNVLEDDEIRTHNDATEKIIENITSLMDKSCRNVFIGHSFVTPSGEEKENTSDSERPLSIGGAEHIDAQHFKAFHYTALGHLHQAHHVSDERIRYAGSILKYSISEEHHKKGFNIIEMDAKGEISVEKRDFIPRRDMRTVEASLEDLLKHPINEDYVFVRLTDETPILSPMEKVKSVYPNAMHVERENYFMSSGLNQTGTSVERNTLSDLDLFKAFYQEVKGTEVTDETETIFKEVLNELLTDDNESSQIRTEQYTTSK